MSEYPDTMKYPSVYEMDCNGEVVMIMPLVNNEALFVLLHSISKQDDPNAWSYSCTVDGKLDFLLADVRKFRTGTDGPLQNIFKIVCRLARPYAGRKTLRKTKSDKRKTYPKAI